MIKLLPCLLLLTVPSIVSAKEAAPRQKREASAIVTASVQIIAAERISFGINKDGSQKDQKQRRDRQLTQAPDKSLVEFY